MHTPHPAWLQEILVPVSPKFVLKNLARVKVEGISPFLTEKNRFVSFLQIFNKVEAYWWFLGRWSRSECRFPQPSVFLKIWGCQETFSWCRRPTLNWRERTCKLKNTGLLHRRTQSPPNGRPAGYLYFTFKQIRDKKIRQKIWPYKEIEDNIHNFISFFLECYCKLCKIN